MAYVWPAINLELLEMAQSLGHTVLPHSRSEGVAARVCLSFSWSLGKFRGGTDIKNKQKLFSGNVAFEAQILPSDIKKRRLKKKRIKSESDEASRSMGNLESKKAYRKDKGIRTCYMTTWVMTSKMQIGRNSAR